MQFEVHAQKCATFHSKSLWCRHVIGHKAFSFDLFLIEPIQEIDTLFTVDQRQQSDYVMRWMRSATPIFSDSIRPFSSILQNIQKSLGHGIKHAVAGVQLSTNAFWFVNESSLPSCMRALINQETLTCQDHSHGCHSFRRCLSNNIFYLPFCLAFWPVSVTKTHQEFYEHPGFPHCEVCLIIFQDLKYVLLRWKKHFTSSQQGQIICIGL